MASLSIGCDGEEIPGCEVQPIGMRCWKMKGAMMATTKAEIEEIIRWHAMTDDEVKALRAIYSSKFHILDGILYERTRGEND
tara:strand:- start:1018 stop:1263 length:246 start_codon:yes stop_codon:yes gene_type:complete